MSPLSEQELSQGRPVPETKQAIHWEEEGDAKGAGDNSERLVYDKPPQNFPTPPNREESPDISPS